MYAHPISDTVYASVVETSPVHSILAMIAFHGHDLTLMQSPLAPFLN